MGEGGGRSTLVVPISRPTVGASVPFATRPVSVCLATPTNRGRGTTTIGVAKTTVPTHTPDPILALRVRHITTAMIGDVLHHLLRTPHVAQSRAIVVPRRESVHHTTATTIHLAQGPVADPHEITAAKRPISHMDRVLSPLVIGWVIRMDRNRHIRTAERTIEMSVGPAQSPRHQRC